ncbi:MAG: hypothetical protein FWE54_01645 [Methanimicrococcus sp.]|nr:hypothetical protein [Methanimicrococcus sp.]
MNRQQKNIIYFVICSLLSLITFWAGLSIIIQSLLPENPLSAYRLVFGCLLLFVCCHFGFSALYYAWGYYITDRESPDADPMHSNRNSLYVVLDSGPIDYYFFDPEDPIPSAGEILQRHIRAVYADEDEADKYAHDWGYDVLRIDEDKYIESPNDRFLFV